MIFELIQRGKSAGKQDYRVVEGILGRDIELVFRSDRYKRNGAVHGSIVGQNTKDALVGRLSLRCFLRRQYSHALSAIGALRTRKRGHDQKRGTEKDTWGNSEVIHYPYLTHPSRFGLLCGNDSGRITAGNIVV